MADMSKLKRGKHLGAPPSPDEASTTLREPEVAPAIAAPAPTPIEEELPPKIDARTLRKTGRTVQFSTRVTTAFDRRFRSIAKRDRLLLAQLLELALEAYESSGKKQ